MSVYETIEIVIRGVVQEVLAEITPEGAVLIGEDKDISQELNADLQNEVEEIIEEHNAHLRDEAHYQRELHETDRGLMLEGML